MGFFSWVESNRSNGEVVFVEGSGKLTGPNFKGKWKVVAGTGSFANATGGGTYSGSGNSGTTKGEFIVVLPSLPALNIRLESDGIHVWWDPSATGFTLESSGDLGVESWVPVANVSNQSVTLSPKAPARFFRLRRQTS